MNWYIGYTRPKCEKKLDRALTQRGVETFLPLNKVTRQWSDRKKIIEEPLFPSYIFIRTNPSARFSLLQNPELIRFLEFDGVLATINEQELTGIRDLLARKDMRVMRAEPMNRLPEGTRVVIKSGIFTGFKGVLIKEGNRQMITVLLEDIRQALTIHMDCGLVGKELSLSPSVIT